MFLAEQFARGESATGCAATSDSVRVLPDGGAGIAALEEGQSP